MKKKDIFKLSLENDDPNRLQPTSTQPPINKDAYKPLLGICAYLFIHHPAATAAPPTAATAAVAAAAATGQVCGEVCRGKQGRLKVFSRVPLLRKCVVKVKLDVSRLQTRATAQ